MPEYFLGVDAGGSHTRAILVSSHGDVLGYGQAGAANHRTGSFDSAAAAVQSAVSKAIGNTQITEVVSACIGSAGLEESGSEEEGRKLLGNALRAHKVILDTDAYIAWAGALGLQAGLIVIAGTGSIALGIDAEGNRYRVGGWGPFFGDEGSAYAIAAGAIKEALKALDRRHDDTVLVHELLKFANLKGELSEIPAKLTAWLYEANKSPAVIAQFSLLVAKLAQENHQVSRSILEHSGRELAELAIMAASKFTGIPRLSYGGSVLLRNRFVKEAFISTLKYAGIGCVEPLLSPVKGAGLIALSKTSDLTRAIEALKRSADNF
ncbi:MAG: hypothetical protein KC422_19925 [Trueperaceae bacterium]|nr:hypothetical protein [Trueperaceae bacterium]